MSASLLLSVLVLAQAGVAAPGTQVRALTVTLVDEKGLEVTDVAPADVALLENGVQRDIASFQPDRRPLDVAILVDTSADVGSAFRLSVLEAVVGFVMRLPQGARYAIWTTGDRPAKLVDYTDDRGAAGAALRRVPTLGGNYMLDALDEASADLDKLAHEGDRRVVVAVSGVGPEFSYRERQQAAELAEGRADLFLSVLIDRGDGDPDARVRLGYALDRLANATGGRDEQVLSYMALDAALKKLSVNLVSAYRLRYATLPDIKKRKLELRVARPGTRVLIPQLDARDASRSQR
jgi:VWFA-related protein